MFQRILLSGISFAWTIRITMFLFLALMGLACAISSSNITHVPRKPSIKRFIRPFDELPYLLVAAASFCVFWGLYIPNNFIILYAESIGMSKSEANDQLAILNATRLASMRKKTSRRNDTRLIIYSVLGRVAAGFLADKFGRFNVMIICLAFVTILIPSVWLAGSRETTIAFSVCFGFGSGSLISLTPAIVAQISDIRNIGVRTGMVYFAGSFGTLTGNPISSSLTKGGYVGMQAFCCASIGAGCILFVLARLTQSKQLLFVI